MYIVELWCVGFDNTQDELTSDYNTPDYKTSDYNRPWWDNIYTALLEKKKTNIIFYFMFWEFIAYKYYIH